MVFFVKFDLIIVVKKSFIFSTHFVSLAIVSCFTMIRTSHNVTIHPHTIEKGGEIKKMIEIETA